MIDERTYASSQHVCVLTIVTHFVATQCRLAGGLASLKDLGLKFVWNWIQIFFQLTFPIQICRLNPNRCDKIDSSGSEINPKVQKRSKEIKKRSKRDRICSNLVKKDHKSQ